LGRLAWARSDGGRCRGDENGEGSAGRGAGAGQAITVNWGTEPSSFGPGLASDARPASIPLYIALDDALSEFRTWLSRGRSLDGKRIGFTLRPDANWTNRDAATAHDAEYRRPARSRRSSRRTTRTSSTAIVGVEG
jgi:hypothetical protein